jgi:lipoprotein-releasing system ATP-binding protein
MLQILGGLDQPSAGDVLFDGCNITRMSERERTWFRGCHVGFVFQFHHLLPEFTALENVTMPLLILGRQRAAAEARARELLERVELGGRLTHRPSELSGGEQQRVAIARALASQPSVLLADEATGNLDFETGRAIQELLRQEQRQARCTMILVTHNTELARSMDMVFEMVPGGRLTLREQ